jgi:hypothetical protein
VTRARAAGWLLALGAVTFWLASAIHVGLTIPLGFATLSDPFWGAAIPEAVIGVVVALGAASLLVLRSPHLGVAMGGTTFAIAVTLYGLSVTVRSGRTLDVLYHVSILAVLSVALTLLFSAWLGQRTQVRTQNHWG